MHEVPTHDDLPLLRKALPLHPVTLWQRYVLEEAEHPDCPDDLRDRYVLSKAALIQPKINMRRLRRAVAKLMLRHDSLRIRFERTKAGWGALIDPRPDDVVRQIDLGDLEDVTFKARLSILANEPMPLIASSLFEVLVVHCGARGDVLILRVHHAITDGHGMVVLIEDFAKLLMGMPIFGAAVSHADYIAHFQSPKRDVAHEVAAFWETQHVDLPQMPAIGRKGKGLPVLQRGFGAVDQKKLSLTATPGSLCQFEKRARRAGYTPVTALFAGYLEAMCRCYDLEQMGFMTSVSRTDPRLDGYIGDHTLDPLLPYHVAGNRFEARIKGLGDLIFRARAHLPSDAARRGSAYEEALMARGVYPRQFVLEEPSALVRQNRSLFRRSFSAVEGSVLHVGPYHFEMVDLSVRHRKWGDMHFDVGGAEERNGFVVHFDGISYADAEIRHLSNTICDVLHLEPQCLGVE